MLHEEEEEEEEEEELISWKHHEKVTRSSGEG